MKNMKKTVVIFGITGGIGGAIGEKFFENKEKWEIFGVGRNVNKLKEIKNNYPEMKLVALNDDNFNPHSSLMVWKEIKEETKKIDLIVLAAGNIATDGTFQGNTPAEKEARAIHNLIEDNFLSKVNITDSFKSLFETKETAILVISSHAANFSITDSRRENEEGYVVSMRLTSKWAKQIYKERIYKDVILEEPALINTKKVFEALNKETIGADLDPGKGKSESEYALELYEKVQQI